MHYDRGSCRFMPCVTVACLCLCFGLLLAHPQTFMRRPAPPMLAYMHATRMVTRARMAIRMAPVAPTQVHAAVPQVLLPVLPHVRSELECAAEEGRRARAAELMVLLMTAPDSDIAEHYPDLATVCV